jgi:hypothetical protein
VRFHELAGLDVVDLQLHDDVGQVGHPFLELDGQVFVEEAADVGDHLYGEGEDHCGVDLGIQAGGVTKSRKRY